MIIVSFEEKILLMDFSEILEFLKNLKENNDIFFNKISKDYIDIDKIL